MHISVLPDPDPEQRHVLSIYESDVVCYHAHSKISIAKVSLQYYHKIYRAMYIWTIELVLGQRSEVSLT